MLILQGSEVEQSEVLYSNGDKVEKLPGASYDKRLFTSGGLFPKDQRQEAIDHCRQLFIENKGNGMVLLAENENDFAIWVENPHVKRAPVIQDAVKALDLEEVVAQMRNIGGVKIKNRTYRFKVYPDCFLGTEAVRLFMHQLQLSHEDALRLGQRLIDEKWFHHVSDDHGFKDEELFYRFYWDED